MSSAPVPSDSEENNVPPPPPGKVLVNLEDKRLLDLLRNDPATLIYRNFGFRQIPEFYCKVADSFRARFKERPSTLDDLLGVLSDQESRDVVKYQTDVILLFPPLERRYGFLFHPSTMLTAEELAQWELHWQSYPRYAEKYHVANSYYSPTEFFYHHGLIFLDDAVKMRLRGGIFIDAGAFDGASVIVMHDYAPLKVYGFEPSMTNLALCRTNVTTAGIERTSEFVNCCVGSSDETVNFSDTGDSLAGISSDGGGYPIPMVKLDTFVEQRKLPKISWIKADLEGAGKEMVLGAEQVIRRDKPLLTIGTYHNAEEFFDIPQLLRQWVPEYRLMYRRCQCNPFDCFLEMTLIAYIP